MRTPLLRADRLELRRIPWMNAALETAAVLLI